MKTLFNKLANTTRLSIQLIICVLLLSLENGYSQNLGLKHFTTDDGLPSNTVFNAYFDSKGYMWVATDKGIARYNGIAFETFTTYDGLPDNEVFGFNEDTEGRLWIANFKGLLCYYKDNIFHTAKNTPWLKVNRKSSSNFYGLYRLQKDSSILTESADGKALLIIKNETIKQLSLERPFNSLQIMDRRPILTRKLTSNAIQIFYSHQWFTIDTNSNILKAQFYKDTSTHYGLNLGNNPVLGTQKGIVTPEDFFLMPLPKDGPIDFVFSRSIYIQDSSNVFTTSKYGFYHNQTKLSDEKNYSSITHDNFGNLWISSITNGLYFISKYFRNSYLLPIKMNDKIVVSQFIGNNIYAINENGEVYGFSNTLQPITIQKNSINYTERLTKSNTCILPSGEIITCLKSGIIYKKSTSASYRKIIFQTNGIEPLPASKAINYFDSTIYIVTGFNVFIFKIADLFSSNTFSAKKTIETYQAKVEDRIYHGALHLSDTSLWFSQTDKMNRIKNNVVTEEKELRNHTFRQFEFFKDYLVGTTDENKFFIYNTTSRKLDSISEPNCIWETLYVINDSTAIINTNNSYKLLALLAPLKNGQPNYCLTIVENPFIPKKADYIFGNGITYYFVKNGELSGFPAAMVAAKPTPPQPIFISIKTKERTYPIVPELELSYNESKVVTIQIDNISFNNKEVFTQYSISKNDNDNWNTITGNEISLNTLGMSYGKYIIKLRSKTRASDFSKPIVLILQIATPFWATWWFITLCVMAFILLVLVTIRIIIWRQVRKRQREFDAEMKYQQSEYKALNALMNPHFIFNSLNNIQSLINKDHKETANQYLVIFSKLIRQNMLNVSKGYISLYQEMILIENYLYLEKLRFKELIHFTINIGEDIDTETIMIPPLLIQPVVENAIIHGLLPMQSENSKLSIRIFEVEDVIHVEIIDNGVGLNQSLKKKHAESDSYGLSNLHGRIEHVRKFQKSNIEFEIKELVDENGKTLGTKANITIEQL